MNKILVVNVNWLGDVIFSSPVFKALKQKYPQSRISCLVPSRVREAAEMIPGVEEVIVYGEKGAHFSPLEKMRFIFSLRKRKFDAVFLLHRSLTRALFVFLAGIPLRIGYNTKGRGALLTHAIGLPRKQMHRLDFYLHVINEYGIKAEDRVCELSVDEQSQQEAERFLAAKGIDSAQPFIAVHPGGNWNLKRWPKENHKMLVRWLGEQSGMPVVIIGAEKDKVLAQEICHGLDGKIKILSGETNLKQLAAVFQKAACVISGDSGPFHMANCVGAKTIGLFGPTRPEITGPRGKGQSVVIQHDVGCNRSACYYLKCPDNICMKAISVYDVIEKFQLLVHS